MSVNDDLNQTHGVQKELKECTMVRKKWEKEKKTQNLNILWSLMEAVTHKKYSLPLRESFAQGEIGVTSCFKQICI